MTTVDQEIEVQLMEIDRLLVEVEAMKQLIKERAMLYQADWKERQTEAEGKSFNFYYHMPYVQWDKVRDPKHQ